ncbi:MAG: HAD-IIIA family hydrolase [Deltaproteobacteria bacterium]|nr:HAD-IIIA family hydrolase [Deltaproteobacteria bacterium]
MKDPAASEKLKHIQLLLLDVDGVLTDGGIIYNDSGNEIKIFSVKDGLGLKLVMKAGVTVGIVTGRKSKALHHRCRDLGIQHLFEGVQDKAQLLPKIVDQTGVAAHNIAYMGDDLPDLALMRRVGLSIAVADAHKIVREKSDWITLTPGGCGAVREVCEALLKAKGLWGKLTDRF